VTSIPQILEAMMVIVWFVVALVGEEAFSKATSMRRAAEDATEESATLSSASYCQPQQAERKEATTEPSEFDSPQPPVQAVMGLMALGIGREPTFPYYTQSMKNIRVVGQASAELRVTIKAREEHRFKGHRSLGCLEKPKDDKDGSTDTYRDDMWRANLKGY
jgi:hypothetical protein